MTKLLGVASWGSFLASAVAEFVFDIDFPLTSALWLAIAICFLFASTAHAQFTGNIKTNTINGVTSNWVGNGTYVVGSNTFKDVLQIINSGVLSNGTGYIGYEISGSNNIAIVNGGVWSNGPTLYVGYSGAGNRLIVTNGGKVFSAVGYIAFGSTSSNNTVMVTGTGSVWSNSSFLDIANGAGNQLLVSAGGAVFNTDGYLNGYIPGNNTNTVTVTGTGSVWSNNGNLY